MPKITVGGGPSNAYEPTPEEVVPEVTPEPAPVVVPEPAADEPGVHHVGPHAVVVTGHEI